MTSSAFRAVRWVLGVVLVIALAAGGLYLGRWLSPGAMQASTSSSAAPSAAGDKRLADLRSVIEGRPRAALAKDKRAWLADVDPAATEFRAAQATAFDGLATLPVADLSYRVQRLLPGPAVADGAPTGKGPVQAEVVGTWSLTGLDRVPAPFTVVVTAKPSGDSWLLTSDDDPRTVRQAFELPGVTSVRRGNALVIGNAPAQRLAWYGAAAPTAAGAVAQALGGTWPGQLVVVAPATAEQFAMLDHGSGGGLGQVAAVTYGSLQTGRTSAGDKILINPDSWTTLGDKGRRLVLRHETVHVAIRATTTHPVPDWLSEGLAQVIAYDGLDVDVAKIAARRPNAFPPDRAFDPSVSTIEPAYEMSWLAVHYLAQTYTMAKVIAMYRAAGSGVDLASAMTSTLGRPLATVQAEWVAWARAEA